MLRKKLLGFVLLCTQLAWLNAQPSANHFFQPGSVPYGFDELQPLYADSLLNNLYFKVHKEHVRQLNRTLFGSPYYGKTIFELQLLAEELPQALKQEAVAHYNYRLMWESFMPIPSLHIHEEFISAVVTQFGDFKRMIAQMADSASTLQGNGWLWLAIDTQEKLQISTTDYFNNPIVTKNLTKAIPILAIPMGERVEQKHPNRANYLHNAWYYVEWQNVADRYNAAINSAEMRHMVRLNYQTLQAAEASIKNLQKALSPKTDWVLANDAVNLLVNACKQLLQMPMPQQLATAENKAKLKPITHEAKLLRVQIKKRASPSEIVMRLGHLQVLLATIQ